MAIQHEPSDTAYVEYQREADEGTEHPLHGKTHRSAPRGDRSLKYIPVFPRQLFQDNGLRLRSQLAHRAPFILDDAHAWKDAHARSAVCT